MTITRDTIAAELLALEAVADFPIEPLGYGVDISCTSDISPRMAEVDPFTVQALAEAIVRRLDCPRGGLADDPNYGLDLRSYCNRGTTAADLRALGGQIRSELRKDDRIEDVLVDVVPSPTGGTLAITLDVTPTDPNLGGFRLTLSASSAETLIEEIART